MHQMCSERLSKHHDSSPLACLYLYFYPSRLPSSTLIINKVGLTSLMVRATDLLLSISTVLNSIIFLCHAKACKTLRKQKKGQKKESKRTKEGVCHMKIRSNFLSSSVFN